MRSNQKGSLILLITAMVWGLAFVAQSTAADQIGTFSFNLLRCLLAAGFMLTAICLRDGWNKLKRKPKKQKPPVRDSLIAGAWCGGTLFAGMTFQQMGFAYYPPEAAASGRAGFLTAVYVVLLPIVRIFAGKRPGWLTACSAGICLIGMYLLCMGQGFSGIYLGDIFELLCAAGFTAYILAVDHFKAMDGLWLSMMQFLAAAALSAASMGLAGEKAEPSLWLSAWVPLLYVGIISGGVGYTMQIWGQKYADPTVASVVMSLESVFAALCGWLLLGEGMSLREWLGCALVFAAVLLSQLPDKKPRPKKT